MAASYRGQIHHMLVKRRENSHSFADDVLVEMRTIWQSAKYSLYIASGLPTTSIATLKVTIRNFVCS